MNNELQHHGILGMHWGIRRFQNKDGSLTSAGKERYKDDKAKPHEDYLQAHSGKSIKEYSTKELQSIVNRLNIEKQYKQLTNKDISKGKKVISNALNGLGGALAIASPIIAAVGKAKKNDSAEVISALTGLSSATALGISKILSSSWSDMSGATNIGKESANVIGKLYTKKV